MDKKYRQKLQKSTKEKVLTDRQKEEAKIAKVKAKLSGLVSQIEASDLQKQKKLELMKWISEDLKTLNERVVLQNVSSISYSSLLTRADKRFLDLLKHASVANE